MSFEYMQVCASWVEYVHYEPRVVFLWLKWDYVYFVMRICGFCYMHFIIWICEVRWLELWYVHSMWSLIAKVMICALNDWKKFMVAKLYVICSMYLNICFMVAWWMNVLAPPYNGQVIHLPRWCIGPTS